MGGNEWKEKDKMVKTGEASGERGRKVVRKTSVDLRMV